jgi:hypothetical protein
MCRKLVVPLLALVALTALGIPSSGDAAAPTSNRISWNGADWYLHGANLPWYNWGCDFGCGGAGGASDPVVQTAVGAGLEQMQAGGMHVARWWVFPGDPWQITRGAGGAPAGIEPAVFADLDAALQLAETYDIYYVFTLFSAPSHIPQPWLTDPTQRSQLADALTTLFAAYNGHPRVLAWEVFNEPEWDIWNGVVSAGAVQATTGTVAEAVHASSSALVSVGAASLEGLPFWVGQGLDYYTAHWYDPMTGDECALCTDYATVQARYGLDAPLVIGEFYAGPDASPAQRFSSLYAKGYAGAWAWSLFPDRTNDHFAFDAEAAGTFASTYGTSGPCAPSLQVATAPQCKDGSADTDGDSIADGDDPDDDNDGCADEAEVSIDAATGGLRNRHNLWDFYDVPAGSPLSRDRAISVADIASLVSRFGSNDSSPGTFDRNSDPLSAPSPPLTPSGLRQNYHPAYDRGGSVSGMNPWNLLPADGVISVGDIGAVVAQFGHSCA